MNEESTGLQTEPEHIAVSKSKGLKIDWKDGHRSDFSVEFLRDHCPCATCTGAHGTEPQRSDYSKPGPDANPFKMYQPKLRIDHIEEVGSYAIRLNYNDGHHTGIYTWEYLRSLG